LGRASDEPAPLQHVLAHRQSDTGLLLVAQQRQVGVEQVVRGVALACALQPHDVAQHVGERVTGHRAVGAALAFEVEEQPAVAAQDRDVSHRAVTLESAQRGDLLQARPVLVLEHRARRVVGHDAADHRGGHLHAEGQGVVLNDERHVGADRLRGLRVVARDLIVGAQRVGRRDHHAGRTERHRLARQCAHRGEPWRRDTHDHRGLAERLDKALGHRQALGCVELGRFAQLSEHRDAGAPAAQVELAESIDRGEVDGPVVEERRGGNGVDAASVGEQGHGVRRRAATVAPRRALLCQSAAEAALRASRPGVAKNVGLSPGRCARRRRARSSSSSRPRTGR
jgi:hypothetical protein